MEFEKLSKLTYYRLDKTLDRRYYAYVHRIPGTELVFHVGKGTGNRHKNRSRRESHWKALVDMYSGDFKAEIISDRLSEGEALAIEQKLQGFYLFHGHPVLEAFPDFWIPGFEDTEEISETAWVAAVLEKSAETFEDKQGRRRLLYDYWQHQLLVSDTISDALHAFNPDKKSLPFEESELTAYHSQLVDLHDLCWLPFLEAYESWLLYCQEHDEFLEMTSDLLEDLEDMKSKQSWNDYYRKLIEQVMKGTIKRLKTEF